jgi:hypothetical protein
MGAGLPAFDRLAGLGELAHAPDYLVGRYVLDMAGDRPRVPERVDDEAVAIARSGIGFGVAVCDICPTPFTIVLTAGGAGRLSPRRRLATVRIRQRARTSWRRPVVANVAG